MANQNQYDDLLVSGFIRKNFLRFFPADVIRIIVKYYQFADKLVTNEEFYKHFLNIYGCDKPLVGGPWSHNSRNFLASLFVRTDAQRSYPTLFSQHGDNIFHYIYSLEALCFKYFSSNDYQEKLTGTGKEKLPEVIKQMASDLFSDCYMEKILSDCYMEKILTDIKKVTDSPEVSQHQLRGDFMEAYSEKGTLKLHEAVCYALLQSVYCNLGLSSILSNNFSEADYFKYQIDSFFYHTKDPLKRETFFNTFFKACFTPPCDESHIMPELTVEEAFLKFSPAYYESQFTLTKALSKFSLAYYMNRPYNSNRIVKTYELLYKKALKQAGEHFHALASEFEFEFDQTKIPFDLADINIGFSLTHIANKDVADNYKKVYNFLQQKLAENCNSPRFALSLQRFGDLSTQLALRHWREGYEKIALACYQEAICILKQPFKKYSEKEFKGEEKEEYVQATINRCSKGKDFLLEGLEMSINIQEAFYGKSSLRVAAHKYRLASFLIDLCMYNDKTKRAFLEKAQQHLRETQLIYQNYGSSFIKEVIDTLERLSLCCYLLDDFEKAIEYGNKAIKQAKIAKCDDAISPFLYSLLIHLSIKLKKRQLMETFVQASIKQAYAQISRKVDQDKIDWDKAEQYFLTALDNGGFFPQENSSNSRLRTLKIDIYKGLLFIASRTKRGCNKCTAYFKEMLKYEKLCKKEWRLILNSKRTYSPLDPVNSSCLTPLSKPKNDKKTSTSKKHQKEYSKQNDDKKITYKQ